MIQQLIQFVQTNLPTQQEWIQFGPLAFFYAYFCLWLSGFLRRKRKWRTGLSRKLFHFLIFFMAALVQWQAGLRGVCLFGAMTSLVIAIVLHLNLVGGVKSHFLHLFHAIARPEDKPYRVYYIVCPYLATLFGGVFGNIYFGTASMAGYLVTGVADSLAEPIGIRYGRHRYQVLSLSAEKTTRSIEGSTTVFISSFLMLLLAMLLTATPFSLMALPICLGIAAILTIVEAISPHGWDNLSLQLVATWLFAKWVMGAA